MYALSENVTIKANNDFVNFQVEGDVGQGSVKLNVNNSDNEEERTVIKAVEEVEQQFALRYLNMFNKASVLSSSTSIFLHSEQPVVVDFQIESYGHLKFYLAPKINDE